MKIALIILLYFGQSTEPAHVSGGVFDTKEECNVKAKDMTAYVAQSLKAGNMVGVTKATIFCQAGADNFKKVAQ